MADVTLGGMGEPASFAAAVTPNDVTVITTTRALAIGGAGTISVVMAGGGNTVSFTVIAGALLPIRVTKVNATGTTATLIVALW